MIAPIVHGPVFVFLFVWFLVALGYRIARILGFPLGAFTQWERGLLCSALGAGSIQYVVLVLGAIGQLTVVPVRLTVAVIAMCLVQDFLRIARSAGTALRELQASWPSRSITIWFSILVACVGTRLVRSLVVDINGDDDGYHLTAPRRWLEAGTLAYLPTYTHTTAPMGFEMLYLIGLAAGTVEGAKLIHLCAGCWFLLGVFLCGRRLGGRSVGIVAITLIMLPNPILNLPVLFAFALNDLGVCWMAIASLLSWLVWREHHDNRILMWGALCAGFAGSFKLTALSIGMALTLIVFYEARGRGLTWKTAISLATSFGTLALAAVVPWLCRSWLIAGNPLYPMFSGIIPTRDWSAEQGRVFGVFFRYYNWAIASGSRLSWLQRREILLAVALAVLLAFIVAIPRTKRLDQRGLLLFAGVVLLMALALTGLYFRFWLPALVCLALFVASWCRERFSERTLMWSAVLILVGALSIELRAEYQRLPSDVRMATGLTTREQEFGHDPLWNTWKFLNANTPPDAHVLIASFYTTFSSSSGGAFWVERPCYVTDSHLQGFIQLNDWNAFLDSISRAGIDFVVISDKQFSAGRLGFSFTAGDNEYPFCERLVKEYGTLVDQHEFLQVYRLRTIPSAQDRLLE